MGELLNLIGLSTGVALYAMLLVMVVRGGRTQEFARLSHGGRRGGEARQHPGDSVPWLCRTGRWAGRGQCGQGRVSTHGAPARRRAAGLHGVA